MKKIYSMMKYKTGAANADSTPSTGQNQQNNGQGQTSLQSASQHIINRQYEESQSYDQQHEDEGDDNNESEN